MIAEVAAQNARHENLTAPEIAAMDDTWRTEVRQSERPLIDSIPGNALSAYLTRRALESNGLITEVFVMDQTGLNVGQNVLTSDYWQGDEPKFQQTYGVGAGSVHVSDITLDSSTETYQGQVSLPLTDASGAVIGAATIGLNAQNFF